MGIISAAILAMLWAAVQFLLVSRIPVRSEGLSDSTGLVAGSNDEATTRRLVEIYTAIYEGAESFLKAEYTICAWFVLLFGAVILVLVWWSTGDATQGIFTLLSFVLGACTSILSGYLGMKVAVYSNVRTTVSAQKNGWTLCFNTAFRAGAVMGFALCGLGIFMLYLTLLAFRIHYPAPEDWIYITECLTGFGLGGSSIAMFGRVGGGIYTKAADVGADLVGKVVHGIPEDDPRNPATIADNVGDNVGDVAGMGSDLFGSFAEATCAALVIAAQSHDLVSAGWDTLVFPLYISSVGILVCGAVSFVATDFRPVRNEASIEEVLKTQLAL